MKNKTPTPKLGYNPRNLGHIGKKRTPEQRARISRGLLGKTKSPATRARMKVAANGRWAKPEYREKHSQIMKKRWGAVHAAEKLLTAAKAKKHIKTL